MHWLRLSTLAFAALGVATGCVKPERVAALEEAVEKLKGGGEDSTANALTALGGRIDAMESKTNESIKNMEQMLEVLQREVTSLSAQSDADVPLTPSAGRGAGSGNGDAVWAQLSDFLGLAESGVSSSAENSYTIKRAWLRHAVSKLAAGGKGPKLAMRKDQVFIKGPIKPKTLPADLGLKPNDVILAIGDKEIKGVADVLAALKESGDNVKVRVERRQEEVELTYTVTD